MSEKMDRVILSLEADLDATRSVLKERTRKAAGSAEDALLEMVAQRAVFLSWSNMRTRVLKELDLDLPIEWSDEWARINADRGFDAVAKMKKGGKQ